MSSSTNPEKLVYLQNGVFKRKEMSNGLQYYMNSSFSTIALPSTNGTYMISLQDNVLSLVESSGSGGGEEGEITGTLDKIKVPVTFISELLTGIGPVTSALPMRRSTD